MTAASRAVCHASGSSRERDFANKIERHGSTRISFKRWLQCGFHEDFIQAMAAMWLCPSYKSVNLGNRQSMV
ncbi:hypothetical protein Y032_0042g513 [Ancylostoma ceylanicum]|uniref:Uncharacterized protein n=1 Tax=Ancylostoma ceylanicum TaxID=53326 RepID=A0A016UF25_9BILA|nr:hypothetical protein Y032_0042g513 [Ancylostoma ceylanicum]